MMMLRLLKMFVLLALFSSLSACHWQEEGPCTRGPIKCTAYLQERAVSVSVPMERPIALWLTVEPSVREGNQAPSEGQQQEAVTCTLLHWHLTGGLQGSLKNEEGEPVGRDYKLKEGKQAFVLVLKKMEGVATRPQLTLELEGGVPRKLLVDLTEEVKGRLEVHPIVRTTK